MTRPIPKKPLFPAQAYLDDRGPLLSACRKALYEEFPEHLEAIDEHAKGIPPIASGECWLEVYEHELARLRRQADNDEDAVTLELAPTPPPSKAAVWHQYADPLLRERLTVADLEAVLASLPALPATLAELSRLEDGLIPQVEAEGIEDAKREGGTCKSYGTSGVLRQVAGFNQAGAAAQVAIARAKHAKLRAERSTFRAERVATLRQLREARRTIEGAISGVAIDTGGTTRRLT